MRAEMPSGMGPLRELESRYRLLHRRRHMRTQYDVPGISDVGRTKSTAAAVGNRPCIAHMDTTHRSEVRAEMPSGMVPLRELEDRNMSLHRTRDVTGEGTYTYRGTAEQPTPYTPLISRGKRALHCTHES
jgi:hypothetical protein